MRELRVKPGDLVKKGDTLAIFTRMELDKTEAEYRSDIARTETERNAESAILEKEKELVRLRLKAKNSELGTQIRLLRTEDSLKTAYRKNIYSDLATAPESKLAAEKIAALQKEIASLETETAEELRLIASKQAALHSIAGAKTGFSKTEINFLKAERGRLLLLAPIDGYIEEVYFHLHALVPAHRDLIKINPHAPNRIVGFIH